VYLPEYPDVREAEEVHIVGAGPAGLFAALRLLEQGVKPVVWERGQGCAGAAEGFERHKRESCGESGFELLLLERAARAPIRMGSCIRGRKKRGDVRRILELLVGFGAVPEILVEAHPHIGTNKLPKIIAAMRECILAHGGQVHFGHRVVDVILEGMGILVVLLDWKFWRLMVLVMFAKLKLKALLATFLPSM
jgi:uncharacterized FAD-dependent dehydrogenase